MTKLENNNNIENTKVAQKKRRHWFWSIILYLVYGFLGIWVMLFVALNLPVCKNYIGQKAIGILNDEFKTGIETSDIEINFFGDVVLHDVKIKDHKDFYFFKAEKITATSDWLSLIENSNKIHFKGISIDGLDLKVITYKGEEDDNFLKYIDKFISDKPSDPNSHFKMLMQADIRNSQCSIVNQNMGPEDGQWLKAKNLNLSVRNLLIDDADVHAFLKEASFETSRYGQTHVVKNLSTHFSLLDKEMHLKDLYFQTNKSLLVGDLLFHTGPKSSFSDFSNKVKWDFHLKKNTQISGYDLHYFAPFWDNPASMNISARVTGVLQNLNLEHLVLSAPNLQFHSPVVQIKHVLDDGLSLHSKHMSGLLNYQAVKNILPKSIAQKMGTYPDVFGQINYQGGIDFDLKNVSAKGRVLSQVGQADVDMQLLGYASPLPRYSGKAHLENFDVAALSHNNSVGVLNGDVEVRGESYDPKTMKLYTKSNIKSVVLMGKTWRNIQLDGDLKNMTYQGKMAIDESFAKLNVDGLVDFSSPKLKLDVVSNIEKLNLNYFGVQGDPMNVSGRFDGQLSMTNINDLALDSRVNQLKFSKADKVFDIDAFDIKTHIENNERYILLDAPGHVYAKINGQYQLNQLADMLKNAMQNILAGYPKVQKFKGKYFDMEANVSQKIINYLSPNLLAKDGIWFKSNYNGTLNQISLQAKIPHVLYLSDKKIELDPKEIQALQQQNIKLNPEKVRYVKDSIVADSLVLNIDTKNPENHLNAFVKSIKLGDKSFDQLAIKARNEQNKSLIINTDFLLVAKGQAKQQFDVNFQQSLNPLGEIMLKFDPTSIEFNQTKWQIDTDPNLNQSVVFKKSGLVEINNLALSSDKSKILLNGLYKDADNFDAVAKVQDLDLDKTMSLSGSKNEAKLSGVANGDLRISMKNKQFQPIIHMDVKDIKLKDTAIGNLLMSAENTDSPNIYNVKAYLQDSKLLGKNRLALEGKIDNSTGTPQLNMGTKLDEFDVACAQDMLKAVMSKLRGKVSGDLQISGPLNAPDYSGNLDIKGFGFKVNFTGVDYSFGNTQVPLQKGLVVLNDVPMQDGRTNAKAVLRSGLVDFRDPNNISLDFVMGAQNLLLLDTTQKDFDFFWGKIFARGDLYISGPISALNIDADAKVLGGSEFTLNSDVKSSIDDFKILRFVQKDSQGNNFIQNKEKTGPNMNLSFNLDIDKNSRVNVLLGKSVGDISVMGNAQDLRFNLYRNGNMNMDGAYNINDGVFVSKTILKKDFKIQKGSSLLWEGDALNPQMDITANYTRSVANTGTYLNIPSLPPANVVLETKISKTLKTPSIGLDIKIPESSSQVKETLGAKLISDDVKLIQFSSILALNSFNIDDDIAQSNVTGSLSSQGYNLLLGQVSALLNLISKDVSFNFDYAQSDENNLIKQRGMAKMSYNKFKKVRFNTGIGLNRIVSSTSTNNNNNLLLEFSVEYDFSPLNDDSKIFRAYTKPSNLGLIDNANIGVNQSHGVGLVFSKSFSNFFSPKLKTKADSLKKP
jgi:TamB, inner membrane protein subunit of TAM complex